MFAIRTILLPADFSPQSQQAYRLARLLARDHDARLVLLYVHTPEVIFGEMYPLPAPDPAEERKCWLDQLTGLYPADATTRVERMVKEGDPATEILATARQVAADLIVMGTHGRSGLGRLVFGSVAEQVLRHALCPVLTVKLPAGQGAAVEPAEPAVAAQR
jgi:nucleotide-binding universal stress UspA family protein